jgi:triosephosphate isomerase
MRNYLIAGNWKMNHNLRETKAFFEKLGSKISAAPDGVELLICPVYTTLSTAVDAAAPIKGMHIGAQNMHFEKSGAYTGEVTAEMIKETGASHVIIGHSERREYYNETNESVNKKTKAALATGLTPVVCVGETLEQRKKEVHFDLVANQVEAAFKGIAIEEALKVVIAYEPVWAIGTGETATPQQAQQMHAFIRKELTRLYGADFSDEIRILYGGSMKPDNAGELLDCPDVDGGLIGGASLQPESYYAIIEIAANAK